MTYDHKLDGADSLIQRLLDRYHLPCVLWSGGKDSMVLLDMVLKQVPHVDVVCWREPWMPHKQKFVNRIIEEWDLTVWDWHPQYVALAKGNGRVDVLNHYGFGTGTVMLARGTERPHEGEPWLCARDTFLKRPLMVFKPPWGIAFHGHKSTDKDLLSGEVPLEVDLLDKPGMPATAYPLRHWTDEDIWAYTEQHCIPYDEDRYRKINGSWEVLPYQRNNPDFYPACVQCLDPDAGEFVNCPKLRMQIPNISQYVTWQKPQLSYCNLNTDNALQTNSPK